MTRLEAVNWVLSQVIGDPEVKFVLVAYADGGGSLGSLNRTEASEQAIERALARPEIATIDEIVGRWG